MSKHFPEQSSGRCGLGNGRGRGRGGGGMGHGGGGMGRGGCSHGMGLDNLERDRIKNEIAEPQLPPGDWNQSLLEKVEPGTPPLVAVLSPENCLVCGICFGACPEGAIGFGDMPVICMQSCTGCGLCVQDCPAGALSLVPRKDVAS